MSEKPGSGLITPREGSGIVAKVDSGRFCAAIWKVKAGRKGDNYSYQGVITRNGSENNIRLTTNWVDSSEQVRIDFRHIARSILAKF